MEVTKIALEINFEKRAREAGNTSPTSCSLINHHHSHGAICTHLSLYLFLRPPSMDKHNTVHYYFVRREINNLLSLAFGDLYNRQCLTLFSLSLYLSYYTQNTHVLHLSLFCLATLLPKRLNLSPISLLVSSRSFASKW